MGRPPPISDDAARALGRGVDDLVDALGNLFRRGRGPTIPVPRPPVPVPPPPIPVPVPPGNPPAAPPGTVPGTTPGAQAPAAAPESLTGEGYQAPPLTGTDTNSVMGTMTRAENRIRRRTKSCCKPLIFVPAWMIPRAGSVSANIKIPITFTDRDYGRFNEINGGYVAAQRGWKYQVITCGDIEYSCSGGGVTARPDGERRASCWMREAKYQSPRPVSGFPNAGYLPTNPSSTQEQFRKYGRAANNPNSPAKPCWHIGLDVNCSQMGGPIAYYWGLLKSNRLEGIVRFLPVRQEALNEINRANEALRNREQGNE